MFLTRKQISEMARAEKSGAVLAINPSCVELNKGAVAMLGNPERVEFAVDPDTGRVAFYASPKGRLVSASRGTVCYMHSALQGWCVKNGGLFRKIKGWYDATNKRVVFQVREG